MSLQASLADAQNLLDEVIENCDHLIEKDNNIVLVCGEPCLVELRLIKNLV